MLNFHVNRPQDALPVPGDSNRAVAPRESADHCGKMTVNLNAGAQDALCVRSGLLGVYHQQHDPADERERSDGWRDEVVVGGLKAHSEELDGLSRGREGDARVCEHHNAQRDQDDCNDGFCIHYEFPVCFLQSTVF